MARNRRCPRPINRLVMLRTKGLEGPRFQNTGPACVKGQGNFYGVGGPGSGPRAVAGVAIDANTVEIRFTQCVVVNSVLGVRLNIDNGGWSSTSSLFKVSDTVWRFTTAVPIEAEDTVRWGYQGGTDSIVDCTDAEDTGELEIAVTNPLTLPGNFALTEEGGSDIVLAEEDTDGTNGILTEEAA